MEPPSPPNLPVKVPGVRGLELLAELAVTLSGLVLLVGKAKVFPPGFALSAPASQGDFAWAVLSLGLPVSALVAVFLAHRRAGGARRPWRTLLTVLGIAELVTAVVLL